MDIPISMYVDLWESQFTDTEFPNFVTAPEYVYEKLEKSMF